MKSIGKRVFDDLYLHVSAIESIQDEAHQALITAAFKCIPEEKASAINVVKLNLSSGKISLLEYEPFDESAFPMGAFTVERVFAVALDIGRLEWTTRCSVSL